MDINSKLKQLRKQKGINQDEAAQLLGVSLSSYQKYEREKNSVTPSLEVLIKLADFYGVTTDYLLGREPAADPLAGLNIDVKAVDSNKFIETYEKLPETAKQIFIDTMLKLSEAAVSGNKEYLYSGWTAEQLHAELDRQLKAEETAKERSGAS